PARAWHAARAQRPHNLARRRYGSRLPPGQSSIGSTTGLPFERFRSQIRVKLCRCREERMTPEGILLLTGEDVSSLLSLDDCIAAVEAAFRQHGQGQASPPKVLGMPAGDGGFHIKAATLGASPAYFATKINGNFPGNRERFNLPTIQGLIVLCDAINGSPLAVMDSIEITTLRTGAATAVAARYLARSKSKVATICGCGNQGRVQLRALCRILPLDHVYAFDLNAAQAHKFAADLSGELPETTIEAVK